MDEVSRMLTPGPELDARVGRLLNLRQEFVIWHAPDPQQACKRIPADRYLGLPSASTDDYGLPKFSTDDAACFALVRWMQERGEEIELRWGAGGQWRCYWIKDLKQHFGMNACWRLAVIAAALAGVERNGAAGRCG